jgi:hypothetical protein
MTLDKKNFYISLLASLFAVAIFTFIETVFDFAKGYKCHFIPKNITTS